MKARYLWIAIAAVLSIAVGARIVAVRRAASQPAPAKSEASLIRVARIARGDVAEKVSLTGTVRPRNEVDVFARVPGRIETLGAQVGDRVAAGQLLASIEHKEVGWQAKAAEAALSVARANLDGAKLEFDRTQQLFQGGAAPQAQLDGAKVRLALAQAQAAQAEAAAGLAAQQLANASIESPISGTVIRRAVNVGAQVGPQMPMYTIQDIASLKLESSVDASTFARLAKGKEATVTVDELSGKTFPAKVSLLSPALDPQTRRAWIELSVDNRSGGLLPNMFAHAELLLSKLHDALVVPREAVLDAAGGRLVFRIRDDRAEAVRPTLGPGDGERMVVLTGLAEGDVVAVTGVATLSDGAPVKVAEENANGQRKTAHLD